MKYLGIDWGMKKLGMALSEGDIASPYKTVEVHNLDQALQQVKEIAKKEQVDLVIVGMPEGEMGLAIVKACQKLQTMGVRVMLTDETLSTQTAQAVMRETGKSQKDRREDDAMSAALILQGYLDDKP